MNDDDEIEQLAAVFRGLGADDRQATVMASQLAKRASQLSSERGITRIAAMDHLLKITISGRQGEAPLNDEAE